MSDPQPHGSQSCTQPQLGEYLTAYEMRLLDAVERVRFEDHLHQCGFCSAELYDRSATTHAMQAQPAEVLKVRFEDAPSVGDRSRTVREPSAGTDRWWERVQRALSPVWALPAAGLAVLFLLFILLPEGSELADLANTRPLPYAVQDTRGSATVADQIYRRAMEAYADQDYGAAAQQLEEALAEGGEDWTRRSQTELFLGISYLQTEEFEEAGQALDAARASRIPAVSERATWFRSQLFLLLDDVAGARTLLQRLAESSVGYRAEASTLLKALDEIAPSDR